MFPIPLLRTLAPGIPERRSRKVAISVSRWSTVVPIVMKMPPRIYSNRRALMLERVVRLCSVRIMFERSTLYLNNLINGGKWFSVPCELGREVRVFVLGFMGRVFGEDTPERTDSYLRQGLLGGTEWVMRRVIYSRDFVCRVFIIYMDGCL